MPSRINRREYLQRVGAWTGGMLAAGYSATAKGFAANETISIGVLGTGSRSRQLMSELKNVAGVRIVALCDIWDQQIERAKPLADPQATVTQDYQEILAHGEIDAVLIGTPDHWHVPMTVDACKAGKDVYIEKPLTHKLAEGQAVIDAQNDHNRIVQVGMQQRAMPQFIRAAEIVKSGRLGDIHRVDINWNRNFHRQVRRREVQGLTPKTLDWKRFLGSAPDQPFDAYRYLSWRMFWDFGGGIATDLMTHFYDSVPWFMGVDPPATAATIGGNYVSEGVWETPDTIQTLCDFPSDQLQVHFVGSSTSSYGGASLAYKGSKGTLYLDRGRMEFHPETDDDDYEELHAYKEVGRGMDTGKTGTVELLANWIESIRSRNRPMSPAEAGVAAVAAPHMANIAYRTGKIAKWSEVAGN